MRTGIRRGFPAGERMAKRGFGSAGVDSTTEQRIRITVRGAVQGVGFRPFIYRLARESGLSGWVMNSSDGVVVEAEGAGPRLEAFLLRIEKEKPRRSSIQGLEYSFLDPAGFAGFEIRPSQVEGFPTVPALPDIAVCADCLGEISDPRNRRFRYPFTNCTNCGPRFTIIESLPYDRAGTSMKTFRMCDRCRDEYQDPEDRRFHAQPNACPDCGPQLAFWDGAGGVLARNDRALREAVAALRRGMIVAVKGLGGFHLLVDAADSEAVARLRRRKHREEKPFAVMFPSLDSVRAACEVSELEARLLLSPEAPIVLLRSRVSGSRGAIVPSVAPGNPDLGVLLPYAPVHHLLMEEFNRPVVATSGNRSDEPICTDEKEAVERLGGIADRFLVHNRPIVRRTDDSVIRIMMGRGMILRRARGYAPLPVSFPRPLPSVLAVGGHLKNTVALTAGNHVFVSPHIGDLETKEALEAFQSMITGLRRLYAARPERILCDLHPDYRSTRYARSQDIPVTPVQHHHAHVASCMAENGLDGPVLGVAWDGTGYGPDGTVWGGEFLRTDAGGYRREASFRQFRLPGGEAAVREPRRSAAGLLFAIQGEALFDREEAAGLRFFHPPERTVLRTMLARGVQSPWTSSAGRLFDAVAALIGLRGRSCFEAQAAMELEYAIGNLRVEEAYAFEIRDGERGNHDGPRRIVDWEDMIRAILRDVRCGLPTARIAARFHNTLAEIIVEVARRAGQGRIVLTGGCFQNRYLTERAVRRLRAEGFRPYWHQRIPPNDGGIALGQVRVALQTLDNSAEGPEVPARPTEAAR